MDDRDKRVHRSIHIRIDNLINKDLQDDINDFVKALKIGYNIKPVKLNTIEGYVDVLIQLNKLQQTKKFIKYTKKDLLNYFNSREEKGLAQVSINLHKIRLKRYFTWLHQENKLCKINEIPEIVSWIHISKKIKKAKSIEDVLTPSQIQAMINATDNLRDKCLLSIGFEGGLRISELLGIKIKDISFNQNYAYIDVDGKTGHRKQIFIESYPHLMKWLEVHPFKTNREHYLFIAFAHNYYGNQLYEYTVGSMLKTLAKRVGINKSKITCHTAFRHSRLTYLASSLNWNESKLRAFAGWSGSSNMTEVYCHGSEKDVYDALLYNSGILTEKEDIEKLKEKEAMKPIICPKCNHINPAGSLYCNCGLCLNYDESLNIEENKNSAINEAMGILMEIANNPERMKLFNEFCSKNK